MLLQETAADRAPHMSVAQEKASLLRGEASEQLLVETQEGDSIPINSTELAADSQVSFRLLSWQEVDQVPSWFHLHADICFVPAAEWL